MSRSSERLDLADDITHFCIFLQGRVCRTNWVRREWMHTFSYIHKQDARMVLVSLFGGRSSHALCHTPGIPGGIWRNRQLAENVATTVTLVSFLDRSDGSNHLLVAWLVGWDVITCGRGLWLWTRCRDLEGKSICNVAGLLEQKKVFVQTRQPNIS